MKSLLSILLTGGVIAFLSGATINAAEEKPADQESKSAQARRTARPIPFRGKVDKVNLEDKTITVGKRLFHLTASTKILKGDQSAKLADAVVGEKVGGAYVKQEGDKLVAVSVRFGDKPPAKPKAKQIKEKKESQ